MAESLKLFSSIVIAARIAARDLRGDVFALWLLIGGTFVGVAAVALLGATSQSLIDSAGKGALEAVGGDLSFRLFHRPPNKAELAVIRREGDISISAELRPMARAIKNDSPQNQSLLVELKGVDRQYPLYGNIEMRPASNLFHTLSQSNGAYGAIADPALFDALNLKLGDSVQIGKVSYQLRGVLTAEPDRAFRAFTLGPRVMVLNESLPSTGVADEGAEVYFYTRVKLSTKPDMRASAADALARIDQAFPEAGWRMVNAREGVPGVERTFAIGQVLLLFIGLGVMLIGGAGISNAVRGHVTAKMKTVAILKILGATPSVANLAIGFEIMAAVSVGALLGVVLGAFGPTLVASVVTDHLPFPLTTIPSAKPLLTAGLFGILVAALFAWWPLMDVRKMKPNLLLRENFTHSKKKVDGKNLLGAGLILSMLVGLIFWSSPLPEVTVWFLIIALVVALIYYFVGIGLARLAKTLAVGKIALVRIALSNLYRPGSPSGPVVMALGLTLTLLVALNSISDGANQHMRETLPNTAPDVVAFSIDPTAAARLAAELSATGLIVSQRSMPFLHARVQAINGVLVRDLDIPRSLNWVIRGDRGVSFGLDLPNDVRWKDAQAKLSGFSLDLEIAENLGLVLGDTITLNISGYLRTGKILNFHVVDWTGLDLDFPIIATPSTFADIPYTVAMSVKARQGELTALKTFLQKRFPNIPVISVVDVLNSLTTALNAIVSGLRTAALMCGFAALVVLVGSVFQGMQKRTNEAVVFKVLGAQKKQLLGQLLIEFICLGTLVTLTAVPMGLGIGYGVSRVAGIATVGVPWVGGVALAGITVGLTVVVGLLTTRGAYSASPAQILRDNKH